MKKHQQHKKTIGSIYQAAIAIGLTPVKANEFLRIKNASDLKKKWDYHKLCLTIIEARKELAKAASRPSYHKTRKKAHSPYECCPTVIDYLKAKEARALERSTNLATIKKLQFVDKLEDLKLHTNGYGYGYGCVVMLEDNFLVIQRLEHVTWSDKKSRKWPESRSTTYTISLISAIGDKIRSANLESRNGDWLLKVGTALDLPTTTRTAVTQTGSMIPVREFVKLHCVITELRLFGVGFTIYCATKENLHFHASSLREAIRGLHWKMQARKLDLLDDDAMVTLTMARKLGFCPMGIEVFLRELGWEGRTSATAGEIREAIRHIDVSPWVSELVSIGIIKKSNPIQS